MTIKKFLLIGYSVLLIGAALVYFLFYQEQRSTNLLNFQEIEQAQEDRFIAYQSETVSV